MGGGKATNPKIVKPNYAKRRLTLLAVLAFGMAALLWSAGKLQIVQKDFLQTQGDLRYLRELALPAHRGRISDRNGAPLAISSPTVSVWADPRHLPMSGAFLPQLSELIGLPLDALRALLTDNAKKGFLYLQRGLSPEVGDSLLALLDRYRVGAVGLDHEYRRYYPNSEVTAHVIGITDAHDHGQEGLERAYDKDLAGRPGSRQVLQDGRRRIIEEVELVRSPEPGQPLTLSIDRRLQFLAYQELMQAVQKNQAQGGTAVVLDARTSEVLAMVNQPSFNPNDRSSFVPEAMRNRAVIDLFEPGSTAKALAVAAVLEAGKATPNTPVDTRPGHMLVGRRVVKDLHPCGLVTVTTVLTKSSNVGVTKLALGLEPEYMWRMYGEFGIGHATGLHFPGEEAGRLPHFSHWSSFDQATLSFGYSMSMTALQLASAYAVMANDGVRLPVSLLKVDQPPKGDRVLSVNTAVSMRRMLETVVSDQGTAKRAGVEGYRVAGKTGTVEKTINGVYVHGRVRSLFAGMIPATHPRFVMVVMIDDPGGKDHFGGLVAAPVFSAVMAGAMRMFNVPPDAEPVEEKNKAAPVPPGGKHRIAQAEVGQ
jgi:cell division protein FtsI (penicillin-binding protein 3)